MTGSICLYTWDDGRAGGNQETCQFLHLGQAYPIGGRNVEGTGVW